MLMTRSRGVSPPGPCPGAAGVLERMDEAEWITAGVLYERYLKDVFHYVQRRGARPVGGGGVPARGLRAPPARRAKELRSESERISWERARAEPMTEKGRNMTVPAPGGEEDRWKPRSRSVFAAADPATAPPVSLEQRVAELAAHAGVRSALP